MFPVGLECQGKRRKILVGDRPETMEDRKYSGDPTQPYAEIKLKRKRKGMVINLRGSHRAGYPDLWIQAQAKPLPQRAQRKLLAMLHEVRETCPKDFWFFYCDSFGNFDFNPWYLMRSRDGFRFVSLTWANGWEDFVSEVTMLIDHYNMAPADDPRERAVAAFLGYTPLDGEP